MMFNMSGAGLLGVAESGATPRTPEILNSLMSMTNPFDRLRAAAVSPQSDASSSPPSVQTTCSQLIKEGLKLTIQTKRKAHSSSSCSGSPLLGRDTAGSPDSQCDNSNEGLTPEDEERRRRRRERNKIAATKCRQKKRERTNNLVYESEALETQNLDLKSKIQELEKERRKLVDVLSVHKPNCNKHPFPSTSSSSSSSSSSVYQDFGPRSDYNPSCYPSNYDIICSNETQISYHRSSTVIEEIGYLNPYLYKERSMREPVNPYSRSEMHTDDILRVDRNYGNLDGARPYPIRLVASTSSSDYESNPELLDSPSTGGYQFPDDPSSSSTFSSSSSIFPTSSCIT